MLVLGLEELIYAIFSMMFFSSRYINQIQPVGWEQLLTAATPGATLSDCLPPQRLLRRRLGRSGGHGGAIGAECGRHGGTLRAMDPWLWDAEHWAVSNDPHDM